MKLNLDITNLNPLTALAGYCWRPTSDNGLLRLGTVDEYCIQFRTDAKALGELMVEPFAVGDDPVVTVLYSHFDGTDLLQYKDYANGDYAISAVLGNAVFNGEEDNLTGLYNFIMPENNNYCVLMGRDHGGAPKIFADIPRPFTLNNGHTICEPRIWGFDDGENSWKTLYRLDFGPFTKGDDALAKTWSEILTTTPVFHCKFIPGSWNGADLIKPQTAFFSREIEEIYVAETAEFTLGTNLDKRSHVLESRLLDAFSTLPVKELVSAVHWRGQGYLGADSRLIY